MATKKELVGRIKKLVQGQDPYGMAVRQLGRAEDLAKKFAYLVKEVPKWAEKVAKRSKEAKPRPREEQVRGPAETGEPEFVEQVTKAMSLIAQGYGAAYDGLVALRYLSTGKSGAADRMFKKHRKLLAIR
jgi:hypothetical protein